MNDAPRLVGAVEVQVLDLLGVGGCGNVYRGYQASLGRTVAVKILRPDATSEVTERVLAEARVAARMPPHPGIVSLYSVGVTDDSAFLIMEFVGGGTLADELSHPDPLLLRRVVSVGAWLAAALETAHRFGVVHGDVKEANVLLTTGGHPKLSDFGVAMLVGHPAADGLTPSRAAPERLAGGPPDIPGDVYSLGAMLRECVDRIDPYDEPQGTDRLRDLVGRMTAVEPDDRPASMTEVLDELLAIERTSGFPPTPAVVLESDVESVNRSGIGVPSPSTVESELSTGRSSRAGRGRTGAVTAVAALVVAVAAGAFALGRTSGPEPSKTGAERDTPTNTASVTSTTDLVPISAAGIGRYRTLLYVAAPQLDQIGPRAGAAAVTSMRAAIDANVGPTVAAPDRRDLLIDFSYLPARLRLQAYNSIRSDDCSVVRTPLIGLNATTQEVWQVSGQPVAAAVTRTHVDSPSDAHILYMALTMLAGVPADVCQGFNARGVSDGQSSSVASTVPSGIDATAADEIGVWQPETTMPRWVVIVRRANIVTSLLLNGAPIRLTETQQQALVTAAIDAATPA